MTRDGLRSRVDSESEFLDLITNWIERHRLQGGDFSMKAMASAGDAGRNAIRSGYSKVEAFEASRTAYFITLYRDDQRGPEDRGAQFAG
jgi:hypothetical protein